MLMRQYVLLIIVVLYSVCGVTNPSGQRVNQLGSEVSSADAGVGSQQLQVEKLISLLVSPKPDERESSRRGLITFAEASPENRRLVIQALRDSLAKLKLENRLVLEERTFLAFLGVCQVLGKLQAIETIDLLIKFIYCSDGFFANGVGHRPAEDALTSLGVVAVPQLRAALLDQSDRTRTAEARKWIIVICLANIGGAEAKQVLESAKRLETDKTLLQHIDGALATIDRTPSK